MKAENIVNKTRELLSQSNKPYPEIAAETGLGYHWLCALACGKIEDPSASRIQTLYEFLTGEKLA